MTWIAAITSVSGTFLGASDPHIRHHPPGPQLPSRSLRREPLQYFPWYSPSLFIVLCYLYIIEPTPRPLGSYDTIVTEFKAVGNPIPTLPHLRGSARSGLTAKDTGQPVACRCLQPILSPQIAWPSDPTRPNAPNVGSLDEDRSDEKGRREGHVPEAATPPRQ